MSVDKNLVLVQTAASPFLDQVDKNSSSGCNFSSTKLSPEIIQSYIPKDKIPKQESTGCFSRFIHFWRCIFSKKVRKAEAFQKGLNKCDTHLQKLNHRLLVIYQEREKINQEERVENITEEVKNVLSKKDKEYTEEMIEILRIKRGLKRMVMTSITNFENENNKELAKIDPVKQQAGKIIVRFRINHLNRLKAKPEDELGNKTLTFEGQSEKEQKFERINFYYHRNSLIGKMDFINDQSENKPKGACKILTHKNNKSVFLSMLTQKEHGKEKIESYKKTNNLNYLFKDYNYLHQAYYVNFEDNKKRKKIGLIAKNAGDISCNRCLEKEHRIPIKAFENVAKELERCQKKKVYIHDISPVNMLLKKESNEYHVNLIDIEDTVFDGSINKLLTLTDAFPHKKYFFSQTLTNELSNLIHNMKEPQESRIYQKVVASFYHAKNSYAFLISMFHLNAGIKDFIKMYEFNPVEGKIVFNPKLEAWLNKVIKPKYVSQARQFMKNPMNYPYFSFSKAINWDLVENISLDHDSLIRLNSSSENFLPYYSNNPQDYDSSIDKKSVENDIDTLLCDAFLTYPKHYSRFETEYYDCLLNFKIGYGYKHCFDKTMLVKTLKAEKELRTLYEEPWFYNGKYAEFSELNYFDTGTEKVILFKLMRGSMSLDATEKLPKEYITHIEKNGYRIIDTDPKHFIKRLNRLGEWEYIPISAVMVKASKNS